jgi:hypothetical protein
MPVSGVLILVREREEVWQGKYCFYSAPFLGEKNHMW